MVIFSARWARNTIFVIPSESQSIVGGHGFFDMSKREIFEYKQRKMLRPAHMDNAVTTPDFGPVPLGPSETCECLSRPFECEFHAIQFLPLDGVEKNPVQFCGVCTGKACRGMMSLFDSQKFPPLKYCPKNHGLRLNIKILMLRNPGWDA